MKRHLIIGTRGSRLAILQAKLVAAALRELDASLTIELRTIITKGDTNEAPIPPGTVGKAWFTAEIEHELEQGSVDLAVHSLKDLPPELPANLTHLPVLKRADPRDVFISRSGAKLADLPASATVGTDSLRRRALLLHRRPDLRVESLRGNVETRLRKLAGAPYDAIILAAAGLERLGRLTETTEILDPQHFVPAAGQGILAVEFAAANAELRTLLIRLQDPATQTAVTAELAFTRVIGGGCQLPVGCYAEIKNNTVTIHGFQANTDGSNVQLKTITGPATQAAALARQLARDLADHAQ